MRIRITAFERLVLVAASGLLLVLALAASHAHAAGRHHHRQHHAVPLDANGNSLITIDTAAGIPITVRPSFAGPIRALIADFVARGIHPRKIHCAARRGHRAHSYHYSGEACDFDFYRGCMGCSARWTRHIGALVAAHGLRNGCSFGDCGHIDSGRQRDRRHVAKAH